MSGELDLGMFLCVRCQTKQYCAAYLNGDGETLMALIDWYTEDLAKRDDVMKAVMQLIVERDEALAKGRS